MQPRQIKRKELKLFHRHVTRDYWVSLVALLRAGNSYIAMNPVTKFDATAFSREVRNIGGIPVYTAAKGQKRADAKRLEANQTHQVLGSIDEYHVQLQIEIPADVSRR